MKPCLCRVFLLALFALLSGAASAQSSDVNNRDQASSAPQSEARTSADETFELNIAERHIIERGFNASTSVEAGEESARGLRLRVGVGVGADSIDVLLQGVRGRVRFRATLAPLLDRINARRAGSSPVP